MSDKQKTRCLYCGNNPINHTRAFFMQTVSIPLSPLVRIVTIFDIPIFRSFAKVVLTPYLWFFRAIGFCSLNKDASKAFTERSEVIWREAIARGISMEQFVIINKPVEQYRAKINNKWRYFESLPIPAHLPQKSYSWMDDKWLLKKLFLKHKIPVPNGARVSTFKQALAIFSKIRKPVIVKPELGSRGRHTTTFIHTEEELRHGYDVARQLGAFVVVEEMLLGSVYRDAILLRYV
jgi:hypothetical protein